MENRPTHIDTGVSRSNTLNIRVVPSSNIREHILNNYYFPRININIIPDGKFQKVTISTLVRINHAGIWYVVLVSDSYIMFDHKDMKKTFLNYIQLQERFMENVHRTSNLYLINSAKDVIDPCQLPEHERLIKYSNV